MLLGSSCCAATKAGFYFSQIQSDCEQGLCAMLCRGPASSIIEADWLSLIESAIGPPSLWFKRLPLKQSIGNSSASFSELGL